jgi:dienelactone hydrolase
MNARPDQRLAAKYRFDDHDMDLFFMSALSWGPTGGLDIGQAFHVASTIVDGDPDSWVRSFSSYGTLQDAQADAWLARGWKRAAGEARLKAFAAQRSAWQFAAPGAQFEELVAKHRATFVRAMKELELPATFFDAPYAGGTLPGVFFRNANADAPVVLVIGGADTCFEDLFLGVGRGLLERGYSVAIADLPGQGIQQAHGMHWEPQAEKPIGAVIDMLVDRFGAKPGRIALMGLSLGGYFVTRAAGHEKRLGAVIATTPFPRPGELFGKAVESAIAGGRAGATAAGRRARQVMMWKMGTRTAEELVARADAMVADPSLVTVPFLSILGTGDSPIFVGQAREWHTAIRSEVKDLVELDAATGADGHCQVNNRLRLVQEVSGWLAHLRTLAPSMESSAIDGDRL